MAIYSGQYLPEGRNQQSPAKNAGRDRKLHDSPWLRAGLFLVLFATLFFFTIGASNIDDFPHGTYDDECTLCHTNDSWAPAVI